ncbi:MAG: hypothetical protein WAN72_19690 [Candidatus Acidiferrales bacterium]
MNAPAEDWAALDRALSDLAASGCVEVREDGQWLAELASLQCEIKRKGNQALVHLWSDERNLTRRVLRVRERAEDRIVLEVQRFGRAKPGPIRRAPPAESHANNFAPASSASSKNASRTPWWIRSPRLRTSSIHFPACTYAG